MEAYRRSYNSILRFVEEWVERPVEYQRDEEDDHLLPDGGGRERGAREDVQGPGEAQEHVQPGDRHVVLGRVPGEYLAFRHRRADRSAVCTHKEG